jgi:L,D-transpeptidase YcbB
VNRGQDGPGLFVLKVLSFKTGSMKKVILLFCFSWFVTLTIQAQNTVWNEPLYFPALVDQFYQMNQDSVFWFAPGSAAPALRKSLSGLNLMAFQQGLAARKYHTTIIETSSVPEPEDTMALKQLDRYYTDAALSLMLDIFQGVKERPWVGFDAVSEKYRQSDGEKMIRRLLQAKTAEELTVTVDLLEPKDSVYTALKNEYQRLLLANRKDSARLIRLSMNYYRWITHFHFDKMIVINLTAARLYYYENNQPVLQMKTIVGKTSTPSPRFAAWCDQAILYPYWYVPRSITFNEYLPVIRKNPSWLDAKNMQVIDGMGRVVNHHQLDWSSFHSGYFPYTIRQSTGCDNALGVIKFNISTPYGVYLHDTNNKQAFSSGYRYLSHGCIRLEDPFELGYHLLSHTLDTAFLQSCYRQQKPVYEKLDSPVPVFTVYMPVWPGQGGKITYYKDVYRLLKHE